MRIILKSIAFKTKSIDIKVNDKWKYIFMIDWLIDFNGMSILGLFYA